MRLNVFFPPKSLEIIVERPESRVKEGQYDRTTEYLGDKLKQLTQIPRHVNGFVDAPKRKSPASRNERIKLVIAGELVRLKCVAGNHEFSNGNKVSSSRKIDFLHDYT